MFIAPPIVHTDAQLDNSVHSVSVSNPILYLVDNTNGIICMILRNCNVSNKRIILRHTLLLRIMIRNRNRGLE